MFLYTLAIAILMVSRLPVFSGKRVGKRVAPEMVLPVFVLVVAFFALLIAYPWVVLTIGTVLYLASLPFGVHRLPQVRAGRRRSGGRRSRRTVSSAGRSRRSGRRAAGGAGGRIRAPGTAQLVGSIAAQKSVEFRRCADAGAALPS